MSKTLVAYFSVGGTTAEAAKRIARLAGADMFEIRPAVPYTRADLDWNDSKSRTTLEMKDPASRPEIETLPENLGAYDRIFVGFPIWWYTAPRIIASFLDGVDLSGKTVVPFASSGGSGLGGTVDDLKKCCNARILNGKMINRRTSDSELENWIKESV